MNVPSCRFCDIAGHRLPASFVFDSPEIVAFMDAFPISYGHVLVVPTAHYASIFEMPEELVAEAFKLSKRICVAARSAIGNVNGVNLLQNNGDSAGQKIPHFHIHVIPRASTANEDTRWTPFRKPAERGVLDDIAERIRRKLISGNEAGCEG
ncbi:MAG: HIT domain-containing protein [Promethearchaeati archaeon SRVP18_Atabeyarchaeia-1]